MSGWEIGKVRSLFEHIVLTFCYNNGKGDNN
jgi:hypothetical protein